MHYIVHEIEEKSIINPLFCITFLQYLKLEALIQNAYEILFALWVDLIIFILFFSFSFLVCPIWLPVFFLVFYNEPELGVGIDPGMALTPFPSSIGIEPTTF
jgi:hypothetical protein